MHVVQNMKSALTGKAWAASIKGCSGFMKISARMGTFWNRKRPYANESIIGRM
jgi:hypothetical protein